MRKNPVRIYRELSPAVRTSVWFTICNFLQRGTALITVPIFTRLLTTREYGVCNIYFAWFDIFVLFTSLKLPYEGLNNGLIRHEEDQDGYTSAIAGLIIVLTFGAAGVYLLLHPWIDHVTGLSPLLMGFMLVNLLLNPALYLWMNRERFDFRYRWPVVVTLISTVLNPAIGIAAVRCTPWKAEARILGTVLVQSLSGLVCYGILFYRGKKFYQREYWRFALTFNLPMLFYYLSQSVLNQSDRLMINYFIGSDKAGIYSVAYSVASLMLLLVSAVNGSFNPWIYKQLKAGRFHEVSHAAVSVSLIVATAVVAMTAFAPDVVALLATPDYYEAIWIIPPVSASVFFIFAYMMFANIEMYYQGTGSVSLISAIAAVANLVLNAIFIPLCGYLAAGWTTLVCYVLLAGMHYLLMRRVCRAGDIPASVLRAKPLFFIAGAVIALSFAMMGIYQLGKLRYAVLVLEGALLFLGRKRIAALLKCIQN